MYNNLFQTNLFEEIKAPLNFNESSQSPIGASNLPPLDYFASLYNWNVYKEISVKELLEEIKNGNSLKGRIEQARRVGKGNEGYDKAKKSLPLVTWMFKFDGYKEEANILCSTRLLYFDIDKETAKQPIFSENVEQPNSQQPSFDINSIDKKKIYAYWKSVSNEGYSIIVKANGITKENFDLNYKLIAKELGIEHVMDKNAKKKSQATFISYDPDIFVNESAFVFEATNTEETKKVSLAPVKELFSIEHIMQKEKTKKTFKGANDTFFRSSNIDELISPDEYNAKEEGYLLIKTWLPAEIKKGNRHKTLTAYFQNLVYLNPEDPLEKFIQEGLTKNLKLCKPPLEEKKVIEIVKAVYHYLAKGKLEPIHFLKKKKLPKMLFGRNSKMDTKDKQSYAAGKVAEWKRNKTKHRIYEAIESSTGKKITIKTVSMDSGISIPTVKRYWSEFKVFVKELNAELEETIISEVPDLNSGNLKPDLKLLEEAESIIERTAQFIPDSISDTVINAKETLNDMLDYADHESAVEILNPVQYPPDLSESDLDKYHVFCQNFDEEFLDLLALNNGKMVEAL